MADLSIAQGLININRGGVARGEQQRQNSAIRSNRLVSNPIVQSAIADFATGEYSTDEETRRLFEKLSKFDPNYKKGLDLLNSIRQKEATFRTQDKPRTSKAQSQIDKQQARLDRLTKSSERYNSVKSKRNAILQEIEEFEGQHTKKTALAEEELADLISRSKELETDMTVTALGSDRTSGREVTRLTNELKETNKMIDGKRRQVERLLKVKKTKRAKKSLVDKATFYDNMLKVSEFAKFSGSPEDIKKTQEDLALAKTDLAKEIEKEKSYISPEGIRELRKQFRSLNPGKRVLREFLGQSLSTQGSGGTGGPTAASLFYEKNDSKKIKDFLLAPMSNDEGLRDPVLVSHNESLKQHVLFENSKKGYKDIFALNQATVNQLTALKQNMSKVKVNQLLPETTTRVELSVKEIKSELNKMKKDPNMSNDEFNTLKLSVLYDSFAPLWEIGSKDQTGTDSVMNNISGRILTATDIAPTQAALSDMNNLIIENMGGKDGFVEKIDKTSKSVREYIQSQFVDIAKKHKLQVVKGSGPFNITRKITRGIGKLEFIGDSPFRLDTYDEFINSRQEMLGDVDTTSSRFLSNVKGLLIGTKKKADKVVNKVAGFVTPTRFTK